MKKMNFNDNWEFKSAGDASLVSGLPGSGQSGKKVHLPYDAMIHEQRTKETANRHQTGWYPGGRYVYSKSFETNPDWSGKRVKLLFEGVYGKTRVFLNSDFVGGCRNGYTEFVLDITDFLKADSQNFLEVKVDNTEENSRWYSGSGIYRPVSLIVEESVEIIPGSLHLRVREANEELAVLEVNAVLHNSSSQKVKTELLITISGPDGEKAAEKAVPVTLYAESEEKIRTRLEIVKPLLWSPETPHLYHVSAVLSNADTKEKLDGEETDFGVRTMSFTAARGFVLNGEPVKLRGACIHHDNGILGAATFPAAEERRCRILKEAGFNCIRSAHHPMSRAMLNAFDRLGMLVLDELSDCWTREKNAEDYAQYFPDFWKADAEAMVSKDYNHACVIAYITGNEIQEAATSKGAQLSREISDYFHQLDDSRPVTVAINGLLACMDHMGEIMCSILHIAPEQLAEMIQAKTSESAGQETAGSDEANGSTDLMKGPMADAFAVSEKVTDLLSEFSATTDILGLNYLTARHVPEHTLHPYMPVLGTETLPSDMVRLWKIVRENPHVIGDMTWTGIDYIGEAGSGCFYYDGRHGFGANWPISLAGMGDIDLIGNRRPQSRLREIVYGIRKTPCIAVESPKHYGLKVNQSAWQLTDARESWTYRGYEGKKCIVRVYSDADEIELWKNGKLLGRQPSGESNNDTAVFETEYEPGTLRAVCIRNGVEAEVTVLKTAGEKVKAICRPDKDILKRGEEDIAFLMIRLEDEDGVLNEQEVHHIRVTVSGAGTLEGLGNADPAASGRYDENEWDTYEGCLLAAIRSGSDRGEIHVVVSDITAGTEQKIILKTE